MKPIVKLYEVIRANHKLLIISFYNVLYLSHHKINTIILWLQQTLNSRIYVYVANDIDKCVCAPHRWRWVVFNGEKRAKLGKKEPKKTLRLLICSIFSYLLCIWNLNQLCGSFIECGLVFQEGLQWPQQIQILLSITD